MVHTAYCEALVYFVQYLDRLYKMENHGYF